jgi:hypothetical protein
MRVSELVARLAKLQLEQDAIIQQLADIAGDTEAETEEDTEIRIGDHVLLLTGGVLCSKGDRARVTKVTSSTVHFTILVGSFIGHNSYKKHRNVQKVRKIQQA